MCLCRAQGKKSQMFETQGTVFIPKGDHVIMSANDLKEMRPGIHKGNEDPRSQPTCQQPHEASETAQSSQYLEFDLLKSRPASLLRGLLSYQTVHEY